MGSPSAVLPDRRDDPVTFTLPPPGNGSAWDLLVDAARPELPEGTWVGAEYELEPVSVAVLRSKAPPPPEDLDPRRTFTPVKPDSHPPTGPIQ